MTDSRITATKISADNLQIKLDEPQCTNLAQPSETTNHLKVPSLKKWYDFCMLSVRSMFFLCFWKWL